MSTTQNHDSKKNDSTNNNNTQKRLHPVISQLFDKRGFTPKDINEFFSWNLKDLPDLTSMLDTEKTALRIIEAIDKNQKIAIYGDYDVDGTTSCALFYQFFQMVNVDVILFQPSRFKEGYGVHPSSIDNALEKEVDLLITVDCGISNLETADYAKEKGLDFIITDHHKDAKKHQPKAYAIVNPNRRDESTEASDKDLKALAGVGVAFAICLKVKNIWAAQGKEIPSIYPLLQYVAIGTICDMANLNPMNIKMTRHGLKQLPKTTFSGLAAFFSPEDKTYDVMPSEKISFYVGPLINSKGRLDHPEKALNLIISKDYQEAWNNYSHLEISNRERKIIQKEVFDFAKDEVIKGMHQEEQLASIVYGTDWHEGVIGIVASKLVETFEVPAIVFTNAEEPGMIKASARTAGDLDLFDCLQQCEDLFLKFGGHKAAAGLSMKKDNLQAFKSRMHTILRDIPQIQRTKQDHYDLEIKFEDINRQLLKELESMEPFGMGNGKPIFRMTNARIDSFNLLKDIHVKWSFTARENPRQKLGGISFNFVGKWNTMPIEEIYALQDQEGLTVQFTLGINRFRGNEIIQLMVDKIFVGSM